MDLTIRPMTQAEHNYCYSWNSHLMAVAGCIGHLRGDMGRKGNSFYTTWFDHQENLKTQPFKDELDTVVNALRSDPAYGGALASRGKLAAYCYAHPDSRIGKDGREYGFRLDTENYSYMLRLCSDWGNYNFYIYCYVRESLDCHLAEAERGIRFVTPGYRDLFRLADGDKIRIIKPDGKYTDRPLHQRDPHDLRLGRPPVPRPRLRGTDGECREHRHPPALQLAGEVFRRPGNHQRGHHHPPWRQGVHTHGAAAGGRRGPRWGRQAQRDNWCDPCPGRRHARRFHVWLGVPRRGPRQLRCPGPASQEPVMTRGGAS